MQSCLMIPKLMFFPLVHITFLIKMKEEEGKAEFWNWKKIEYISLEMCLLTQSDIEVQLTIKLNAVLDELNML